MIMDFSRHNFILNFSYCITFYVLLQWSIGFYYVYLCMSVGVYTCLCGGRGTSWANHVGLRHGTKNIMLRTRHLYLLSSVAQNFFLSFIHLPIHKIFLDSYCIKENYFVSIDLATQPSAFIELTFRLGGQSFIESGNKCIDTDFHKCYGESKQDAICDN